MTILYENSVNPDYVEGHRLPSEMNIAAEVCPTFTYYDHHGIYFLTFLLNRFPLFPYLQQGGNLFRKSVFRFRKDFEDIKRSCNQSFVDDR